jgi:Domain of unknown function (DUF6702)
MNTIIQIFVILFSLYLHPLHVTLTNIEFLQEENKYEVTIKIFSDDFEAVIEKSSGVKTNMGKDNEIDNIEIHILEYINERFSIIFDDKKVDFEYISKRNNFEATWVTLKFANKNGDILKIRNELLTELYDDQKNLVIFKSSKIQKGFDLDSENNRVEIRISQE